MADNEYNDDEYQFADLDTIGSGTADDEEQIASDETPAKREPRQGNTIRRNALIAVVVVILVVLGIKFASSYFSHNQEASDETLAPTITDVTPQSSAVTPPPAIQQPTQPPAPTQVTPPTSGMTQPTADNSQLTQKLSALEMGQENVRSDVNSMTNQLNGINSNVGSLSEKIANLNQMISALANKVEQQSSQIALLTERTKPKLPVRKSVVKPANLPIYYIQAVIPGRAWLIAPNGSTLTVREGTQIVGYGTIKLIDPSQGRILTSSGRIIRFSQQDS